MSLREQLEETTQSTWVEKEHDAAFQYTDVYMPEQFEQIEELVSGPGGIITIQYSALPTITVVFFKK